MTIKEVSEHFGISQDTLRYYERVKMIPKVTRTSGGIRDYQEEDLKWVELALCMRSAGLPIEVMIEYLDLYQKGDETIPARLELLSNQMEVLQEQKKQLEATMNRLAYKISKYEEAMKTGKLVWDEDCVKKYGKISSILFKILCPIETTVKVTGMELRVLHYFLTVAKEQSFTKAAEQLHITQPTLSRQLAALEDELGIRLFCRGGRNITLTDDGLLLKRRALEMIDLEDKKEL